MGNGRRLKVRRTVVLTEDLKSDSLSSVVLEVSDDLYFDLLVALRKLSSRVRALDGFLLDVKKEVIFRSGILDYDAFAMLQILEYEDFCDEESDELCTVYETRIVLDRDRLLLLLLLLFSNVVLCERS